MRSSRRRRQVIVVAVIAACAVLVTLWFVVALEMRDITVPIMILAPPLLCVVVLSAASSAWSAAHRVLQLAPWRLASIISLILMSVCFAPAALSVSHAQRLTFGVSSVASIGVQANAGCIELACWRDPRTSKFGRIVAESRATWNRSRASVRADFVDPRSASRWVAYSESPFDWGHRYTSNPPLRSSATWVSFPFWVPIILLGILPARAVWRGWALYYQEKVHPCETCDYDLAGNTSGICPECGTAIPGGAPADQGLEA